VDCKLSNDSLFINILVALSLGEFWVRAGAGSSWGYTVIFADLDGRKIELLKSTYPAL